MPVGRLFSDMTRHKGQVFQAQGQGHLEGAAQRFLQGRTTEGPDPPGCSQDGEPALHPQFGIKGFGGQGFPVGNGYGDADGPIGDFTNGSPNHLPGDRIDGGLSRRNG